MTPRAREMDAVVFTAPSPDSSATRLARLPVPTPGPGQVTIDVRCAGVNFKDVMARRGDAGYVDRWPFVPGLDVAGTIREVGGGVSAFRARQRVAALTNVGGLAEVAVAQADLVVGLPPGLAFEQAAAAPGALLTAQLLVGDVGRVRRGETILVHSASGAVGRAVAQLARAAGAGRLLGSVGAPSRLEGARRAGYDIALVRGPDLVPAVTAATAGRGIDLILDPQGTAQLEYDVDVAAPGARIVLFGNATGAALQPLPPVARLYGGNLSIGGFSLAALSRTAPHRVTAALERTLDGLGSGELAIELAVHRGLGAAAAVQQALADGNADGKHVIQL